jgi:hypothetical protein
MNARPKDLCTGSFSLVNPYKSLILKFHCFIHAVLDYPFPSP